MVKWREEKRKRVARKEGEAATFTEWTHAMQERCKEERRAVEGGESQSAFPALFFPLPLFFLALTISHDRTKDTIDTKQELVLLLTIVSSKTYPSLLSSSLRTRYGFRMNNRTECMKKVAIPLKLSVFFGKLFSLAFYLSWEGVFLWNSGGHGAVRKQSSLDCKTTLGLGRWNFLWRMSVSPVRSWLGYWKTAAVVSPQTRKGGCMSLATSRNDECDYLSHSKERFSAVKQSRGYIRSAVFAQNCFFVNCSMESTCFRVSHTNEERIAAEKLRTPQY